MNTVGKGEEGGKGGREKVKGSAGKGGGKGKAGRRKGRKGGKGAAGKSGFQYRPQQIGGRQRLDFLPSILNVISPT